MRLDTYDYNKQVEPFSQKTFQIYLDTSKLDALLEQARNFPGSSDKMYTLLNRHYVYDYKTNRERGTTTDFEISWENDVSSNLSWAHFEIDMSLDAARSKDFFTHLTILRWSFTSYIGEDKEMYKTGEVSLDFYGEVVDAVEARKAILKATVQAQKEIQKIFNDPATHKEWLKLLREDLGMETKFKNPKQNRKQLNLFKKSLSMVASRLPTHLQEDVRHVLAALPKKDPKWKMDKKGLRAFIKTTLERDQQNFDSRIYDIDLLIDITKSVLLRGNCLKTYAEDSEALWEGLIKNTARNYLSRVGLREFNYK